MTDTITLPRSVVEQALEALEGLIKKTSGQTIYSFMETERRIAMAACVGLREALAEQPQVEQSSVVGVIGWKNHLPNSGTVVHWMALMPPLGTKLYVHTQPPRQPQGEVND